MLERAVDPVLQVQELVSMGSLLDILHTQAEEVKPHYHFKLWAAQVIRGQLPLLPPDTRVEFRLYVVGAILKALHEKSPFNAV